MSSSGGTESTITEEERHYFRSIEERFCALRGASMLLSPRDWRLISNWWLEKVPLPLVLESLEDLFSGRRLRGDPVETVSSLSYLRNEVQRRFRLHRDLVALRRGEEEDSARLRREIRLHLGRLARRLAAAAEAANAAGNAGLGMRLVSVSAEVRSLSREAARGDWEPPPESRLEEIHRELMSAARELLRPREHEALREQARAALGSRGEAMTRSARDETLRAIEENLLMRRWGIPHISLLSET